MTINSSRKNSNQLENCQKFAHKLSWNACICHESEDQTFMSSVNKLARAVTNWTQTCDRRPARLISYIHHTSDFRQYCHVGNSAQHCRLGLFQDSDFAGDLDDSKWTSGGVLSFFGSRTFVPTSWMCKKQTSVSHSYLEKSVTFLQEKSKIDCTLAVAMCFSLCILSHTMQFLLELLIQNLQCRWEVCLGLFV